jgi:CubicO group peptidase (beta-lactamase class C family)
MKRRIAAALCTLALPLLLSCGGQPTVEGTSPSEGALDVTERIEAYLSDAAEVLGVPGLAAAVVDVDAILYSGAFGVRSLESGDPLGPENLFHMASVSKPFVATAIVQLVEQGKIDLDAPVTEYLPYFKLDDDRYRGITIRHMLDHSSGMPDVEDYEWDKPQFDEGAAERYVRSIATKEMIFAPGEDTRYSNMAFDTLGDVIAKVSGMSFDDYMKTRILDPLEMTDSNFLYAETSEALRTTPHVWNMGPVVSSVYPYNRRHAPSSTLNSSVLEMAHWIQANLRRGERSGTRILNTESYDLLWTPSSQFNETLSVGLSWFLEDYEGRRLVGHGGGDTGYVSYILLVPDEGFGIILASNYDQTPIRDIGFGLLDIMLGLEPEPIRRSIAHELFDVYTSAGLEAAKHRYAQIEADESDGRTLGAGALNRMGYGLLASGNVQQAINIFEFNTDLFPDVANVWDSLAETSVKAGDKQGAIEYYRKALEIDPNFSSSRRGLQMLGVSTD